MSVTCVRKTVFLLALAPVLLSAQATRGPQTVPLKPWPAPLYWQPARGEATATAEPRATLPAGATIHQLGETSHRWPSFLPDGRHFLYFGVNSDSQSGGIYLGSLDSNERVKVTDTLSSAQYASGRLLYVRDQNLVAQPFDPGSGRLSGEPVLLFERLD